MDIGHRIRLIRERKGWSQKTLGENCNPPIAEPTIRRYELGKLNPKIETLQKIANALEIPTSTLIDLDEIPSRAEILYKLLEINSKIPISLDEYESGKISITFDDSIINNFLFEWKEATQISSNFEHSKNYFNDWKKGKIDELKFPHDAYTKYLFDEDIE